MTENTEIPSTAADLGSPLYQIFGDRTDRTIVELLDGYTPPRYTFRATGPSPEAEQLAQERFARLVMALHLSMGEYTSYTDMDGVTQSLTTSDGNAAFSDSHTYPWNARTWGNRDYKARVLSQDAFQDAWQMLPTADAIITSSHAETVQAATELLKHLNTDPRTGELRKEGERINLRLLVIPELGVDQMGRQDTSKWRNWFLADLKNSRAHFKRINQDTFEVGILSPFWIYGSFPR